MAAVFLRTLVSSVVEPLLHRGRAAAAVSAGPPLAARPAPPRGPPLPSCLQPALGFKTKAVLRKRCRDCYLVKRRGRWFVLCRANPKHKQRQV
ncbi:39S ribosomal protein L36, mitochondrial [Dipodomys spectabilis]|uniref:39S ribosomal protein L36, mitochondrial n=1 Tax=Dipodomys spectabilis TaxID=105255 RepID=UPI001C54491D|nr:39S ribosomal protein L36, mitochondrial [Dipodomys spectabilis]